MELVRRAIWVWMLSACLPSPWVAAALAAPLAGDDAVVFEGTVRDAERRVPVDAIVLARLSWARSELPGPDGVLAEAGFRTSGVVDGPDLEARVVVVDGSFRIVGRPDELHDLIAVAPFHEPACLRDVRASDGPFSLVLDEPARLVVRVVDADDGAPLVPTFARAFRNCGLVPDGFYGAPLKVLDGLDSLPWTGLVQPEPDLLVLLPAGSVGNTLEVGAAGHAPATVTFPGLAAGERRDEVVRLERLRPLGTLAGRVLDERGEPLRGALVRIEPWGECATTDDRGRWTLTDVAHGPVSLSASYATCAPSVREVEVRPGATIAVDDFVLGPGGVVEGVLRESDGTPIAFGNLTCTALDGARRVSDRRPYDLADAHGRFVLEGLGPGRWQLASGRGSCVEVVVRAGERVQVDLARQPMAVVRGHVRSADGPVAGAALACLTPGMPLHATSAEDGGFEVPLEAGTWSLGARLGQAWTSLVPVTVAWGDVVDTELVFGSTTITGRVTRAGGEPLGDVFVSAHCDSERETGRSARTDAEGRFVFERLPEASWSISVGSPVEDLVPTSVDGVVTACTAPAPDVEIELLPGGFVVGTLVGPDGGAPRVTFEVRAYGALGIPECVAVPSPDGRFVLGPLAAGPHELVVVPSEAVRRLLPEVRESGRVSVDLAEGERRALEIPVREPR